MGATTAGIVTAAQAVFIRYGVARTRMADIAKMAQLARQTLYDFVASRTNSSNSRWLVPASVETRPD